jgi:hypothetical protein
VIASLARLLRLSSIVICLIVIGSFAVFAVEQTKGASTRQQEVLQAQASPTHPAPAHKSGVHEAIDDASSQLTSPFSGIVSGTSSEWTIRGGKLILALLVYGFGLGYLARVIRVRV